MNKTRKILCKMVLLSLLCCLLAGCAPLEQRIQEFSGDKVPCFLNSENVTQFTYMEQNYTILNDTVSNEDLGDWIGYIRQLAAVDEDGRVLLQENILETSFQALADLTDKAPDAAYIIPFLNVYASPDSRSCLIVDVNGGYYKAIPSESVTEETPVFDFRKSGNPGEFSVHPQNATQLVCNGVTYQVLPETIDSGRLGTFLAVLAQNVTFDNETKIPLTKEDLRRIDWSGENKQQRITWFYSDVYEISGTDPKDAVAVMVNNQYHLAKAQSH